MVVVSRIDCMCHTNHMITSYTNIRTLIKVGTGSNHASWMIYVASEQRNTWLMDNFILVFIF